MDACVCMTLSWSLNRYVVGIPSLLDLPVIKEGNAASWRRAQAVGGTICQAPPPGCAHLLAALKRCLTGTLCETLRLNQAPHLSS